MAARDKFHELVKQALINEGWIVTNDPLSLQFGGVDIYIDLGIKKIIAAEKEERKIAVEIKSFLGPSIISDFHLALGQIMSYRIVLKVDDPTRVLYLAIPLDVYEEFFKLEFTQMAIKEYQLKLIVYDVNQEAISLWLE